MNTWFHSTNKLCIWRLHCVFFPSKINQECLPLKSTRIFSGMTCGAGDVNLHAELCWVKYGLYCKRQSVLPVWLSGGLPYHQSTGSSLTAMMQELTFLWWKQGILFGFCSGVAAGAISRSYCYCQRKIKTNLAWLIKAMSINGFPQIARKFQSLMW